MMGEYQWVSASNEAGVIAFVGCVAALVAYIAARPAFRNEGLREHTGVASAVWALEAPWLLVATQSGIIVSAVAAGTKPAPTWVPPLFGTLCWCFGLLCLFPLGARRLPLYTGLCALLCGLTYAGATTGWVVTGAVALLLMQGYEVELWRLLGPVTVVGQGREEADSGHLAALVSAQYLLALLSVSVLFPSLPRSILTAVLVLFGVLRLAGLFAATSTDGGSFVADLLQALQPPPFNPPGIICVQRWLARLTLSGLWRRSPRADD